MNHSHRRRAILALAVGGLLIGALPSASVPPAVAVTSEATWIDKLDQHAYDLIVGSSGIAPQGAGGDPVGLLIAASPDHTSEIQGVLDRTGGTLIGSNDGLGYLRVRLPRSAVAEVVGHSSVIAADLDRVVPIPAPTALTQDLQPGLDAVTPPGPETPETNPYMPTNEIGAVAFRDDHPADPARRVRVGIIDTGVDVAHPALQRAGAPITRSWTTTLVPGVDVDPLWVALETAVTAGDDGTFVIDGTTMVAPAAGSYRLGYLAESENAPYQDDLNGNGIRGERLPILVSGETVWVDLEVDGDFANNAAAIAGGETGLLRIDDPATELDESLTYVAQTGLGTFWDGRELPFVHIGFDQIGHGTHVAGIIAGNRLYGSAANGVAPDVDLYSVQVCTAGGCSLGAMTDALILLAATHNVDVINVSIGGLSNLNDGRGASDIVHERVVREFGVTVVVSAGNDGNGANTVGSPATADRVLGVGASVSAETWSAGYGVDGPAGVFAFSSRGLREDGALKPQVVAPGAAVSALPVAMTESGSGAGYGLKNGTSMAAPMASGAAALLVQAARNDGIELNDVDVIGALVSGARHLDGEDVTSEGAGLIDIERSWVALAAGTARTAITVDAPVCTRYSDELRQPDRGPGIHQRCAIAAGGPAPGNQTFQVTLTRTSGPEGDLPVDLRWRTGSPSLGEIPSNVQLPLGQPAIITVTADLVAGNHTTGLLEIDDPSTAMVDEFLPVSIIVGEQLDPGTLTWAVAGSVQPGESIHHFVEIPESAAFQRAWMTGVTEGAKVRFVTFWPAGVPAGYDETSGCYTGDPEGWDCQPTGRTFMEIFPGVWELSVQASVRSPLESDYTIHMAAAASSALDQHVLLPLDSPGDTAEFETYFASSELVQDPSAFAAMPSESRYERAKLAAGESVVFDMAVPEGVPYITGRSWSVDGATISVEAWIDDQPIGHADGTGSGAFSAFTEPGAQVRVSVTALEIPDGGQTEVRYEDHLHRNWGEEVGQIRITAVETFSAADYQGPLPAWARTVTRVAGTVDVTQVPTEGRVLGTDLRLRMGEMTVLAQTPVRGAPAITQLTVDSGIADATGAEYVVYEGVEESGFEVARATLDGTGKVTFEGDLSRWPTFDVEQNYTVVQTVNPASRTPRERSVQAALVDGAFAAKFVQHEDPQPTDPASTPTNSESETVNPALGGSGSVADPETLAQTGAFAGLIPLLAVALVILGAGWALRRRAAGSL